ncbi:hypothetical protein C8J57DRAFT_1281163 [Mycena rebaudengoi]|nr:hypothetical protein C8J57DRAFT_1281163 [Mycena rebaudengoi]
MTSSLSPSHALPHSQRLRLIRSIRKLGDLLTESSMLVDSSATAPASNRHNISAASVSPKDWDRSGSVTPRASSQTVSGIPPAAENPPSHTAHRSFFNLRVPKSFSSPLSPTFSISLNSPSSPAPVDPEELRRRKQSKINRTLGENVPPQLVFPSPARGGRKRASTVSVPEYGTQQSAAPNPVPVESGRRRLKNKASMRKLHHAVSSASLRGAPQAMEFEPFSYSTMVPIHVSPDVVEMSSDVEDYIPVTGTLSPVRRVGKADGMHRKELGWSGEWTGAVQNMEDVMRSLRDLRLK